MRFVFLASGFLGFALVTLAGLSAGRAIDVVLRDAAFGCLACAFVGRWFWRVLQNAAVQTAELRRRKLEAEAAAEATRPENAPRLPGAASANSTPAAAAATAPAGSAPSRPSSGTRAAPAVSAR